MPAAMVLAAGLGTRLRPLTDHRAKPLVPVGDRPMLAHVLARLRAARLGPLVVNAHHRIADIRDRAEREGDVRVSEEAELLGTAGGVRRAEPLLGEGDVVVWNGDVLAEPDISALLEAHAAGGAAATLVVRMMPPGEGTVGMDLRDRVVRVRKERIGPEADEAHGGEFIGVHVLGESLRSALPRVGCLAGDVYVPALQRGVPIHAFRYAGPFFDIGTLPQYLAANLAWLDARGESRPGADGARGEWVGRGARGEWVGRGARGEWVGRGARGEWVGRGARVGAGVTLDRSILGDGASACGTGALTRCVVWPGAVATAPLSDAIISPELVIGVGA